MRKPCAGERVDFGRVAALLLWISASAAAADPADGSFGHTFELPGTPMDVRVHYNAAGPNSTTVAGEGSIGTNLPGDGRLIVRVPVSVGPNTVLGDTQLSAGYPVLRESELLPKIALTAELALPTAPGSRGARPGMKATATKQLDLGVVHDVHAETELRTDGRELARSYRTTVGTHLRLLKKTTASLDWISLRPSGRSPLQREDHAQVGLCQEVSPNAHLRLGLGAGVTGNQSSLRSTLGVDFRF
jgi:hypothetical protein